MEFDHCMELEFCLAKNGKSATGLDISIFEVILLENYSFEFYQGLNWRFHAFHF